ncbi:nitroreductase family protein [Lacticaseibacillus thailandensis]|uniref:nitroreductase family protein n=1 Tax=Lacticaseibacillus thailandensis TaxID=381741 RepID=UPI0009E9DF82|nr:nitroreductase family protein [Lacticaseibacillus thailandensis]
MLKIDDAALQHRSIRQFADVALTEEQLQTLEAVAQATATSKFMQQFSLIRVTDPQLQHAIAQVTTYQYVEGPGQLYIFVLDQARNVRLVQSAHGDLHQLTNWDALLGGVFDATLAAQNVVAAAERSGLGTVYLGSVLNDPQRMIDLLHLLRYTFPLLGLKVGVPAATPGLKPRWPRTAVVGINATRRRIRACYVTMITLSKSTTPPGRLTRRTTRTPSTCSITWSTVCTIATRLAPFYGPRALSCRSRLPKLIVTVLSYALPPAKLKFRLRIPGSTSGMMSLAVEIVMMKHETKYGLNW